MRRLNTSYSSQVFKPVLPVSCKTCLTHSHACFKTFYSSRWNFHVYSVACFPYSTGHMIYSRLGDQIDSAQCVFRLNAAPTLAHELDVGRKTTARVLSSRRWVAYCTMGLAGWFCIVRFCDGFFPSRGRKHWIGSDFFVSEAKLSELSPVSK